MDILSQMFQFGTPLEYEGEKYLGISQVGYNMEKKLIYWLVVKKESDFPSLIYIIPVPIKEELKKP